MEKVAIVFDEVFLKHNAGRWHPESPERLKAILEKLNEPSINSLIDFFSPDIATKEEILWNHSSELFEKVAESQNRDFTQFDPDTIANRYSFEAALKAVGAQKTALKLLFEKGYNHVINLVRPPGHHAERDRAMGFCFFNNVALCAYYAKNLYNLKRILIVDWDVHHGNGTQNSFYADPEVLFFSVHQYPYYPGTGNYTELGQGEGRGFTINVPLKAGKGDEGYIYIFKTFLYPIASQFKPQLIIVSAGFDLCIDDPLGGMEVSPDTGIGCLTQIVKKIADENCNGKIVFSLEGGYNLNNLKTSIESIIYACSGVKTFDYNKDFSVEAEKVENEVLTKLKDLLVYYNYWNFY